MELMLGRKGREDGKLVRNKEQVVIGTAAILIHKFENWEYIIFVYTIR